MRAPTPWPENVPDRLTNYVKGPEGIYLVQFRRGEPKSTTELLLSVWDSRQFGPYVSQSLVEDSCEFCLNQYHVWQHLGNCRTSSGIWKDYQIQARKLANQAHRTDLRSKRWRVRKGERIYAVVEIESSECDLLPETHFCTIKVGLCNYDFWYDEHVDMGRSFGHGEFAAAIAYRQQLLDEIDTYVMEQSL